MSYGLKNMVLQSEYLEETRHPFLTIAVMTLGRGSELFAATHNTFTYAILCAPPASIR